MKLKYIHIGMPKTLSTTLQRNYFHKHPEIYHLGVGLDSNVDYINPQISSVCENHFVYSNNFSYNKSKKEIFKIFENEFKIFENDNSKKVCGLSLELLSFTFTPDHIQVEEKAKRLLDVFGKSTKILIVVREQFKLIESFYKEAIRLGYYGSYQDYLEYIYILRDRNFIYDFQYDYLYDVYSKYFGKENIEILVIENFRNKDGSLKYEGKNCVLTKQLDKILNISSLELEIAHYNKTLNLFQLNKIKELNKINRHGIGNSTYSKGMNFHRLKDYFKHDLKLEIDDEELYEDVRIKNQNIDLAQKNPSHQKIEFVYPEHIKKFLKDTFHLSNTRFEKISKMKLPKTYF